MRVLRDRSVIVVAFREHPATGFINYYTLRDITYQGVGITACPEELTCCL